MKTYPLLQSQLGVLLQSMQHPGSTHYNLPNYIFMPLSVTRERVVNAVQKLVDSFPELHTRFVVGEQGEVRQWSDMSMPIPVISRKCTEEELQAYIDNEFVRPFNPLGNEPLFRVEVVETEKSICLLSDGYHSIVDGMSFAPILTTAFAKIIEGGSIEPQPYGMYQAAEDEVATFDTPLYQRAKAYYAEKFYGQKMVTLSHAKPGTIGLMGRSKATVSRSVCDDWCHEHGVQPNLLFQAAFGHIMSVLTRQQKVAYSTVNHGRMDKRLRGCVGMFVKTVPMLADADPSQRVIDFVRSQRGELMKTVRYGAYPFTHFCSDLQVKQGVTFNFQAMANMEEHVIVDDVMVRAVQPVRNETDSDLSVLIFLKDENYEIRVESSLAMNDADTLQMVAEAMRVAVCNMTAHPELTLGELDIVSAADREALITLGRGKQMDIDPQMTFVKAFERCASQHSDRLAVADAHDSLTYGELSRRSNVLANRLLACGVRPNDFVAVKLDRTIDFPIAVIAIHKAGAAYVPIDLEYPEERQQYMLSDSEAKVVVDGQFIAETDFSQDATSIDLSTANGLAYMIYTSGSTGKPKGAMLHQVGLWNFINAVIDMEHLTADDRISGHRSFSFDAHIEDLFPILTVGGSFHLMPESIRLDLAAIRDFLFEHQITGGGYATPMATLLLNTYEDLPVRFMTAGGEKLTDVYSDHIEIINVYGPTECTVDTSYYRIQPGCRVSNIPIGQTVANCYHFIVDNKGRLLPRGTAGELCFAGIQVGIGYWKRPELTAEKFCDCPFLPTGDNGQSVRMYRTGDLCRWNEEGQLEFLSRIDAQVKLRGYRIELGEIESCASKFEGISQAVAVIRPIGNTDTLCLYYTVDGDTTVDTDELRQFLSRTLAEYMVPAAYMQIDALPLTPNGKVDRRRLPEPTFTAQTDYVAPEGRAEESIARLLGNVLSWQAPISMLDNFFSLGGDSIKLIHLVSLLPGEGYTAQVSDLMKCGTIREMARTLVSISDGPAISQESVTGVITPGAIQQRFLSWQLAEPGRFTQSVVMRVSPSVDPSSVQQALQALAVHHDMLRATVVGSSIVIRPTTDEHLFALREMTLNVQTEVSETIAEATLHECELIDLEHGPILRAVLLHADDGDRLLIVCHHIAVDGVSWRILSDDLHTALSQLAQGQPISLPRKTHSFAYWTDTVSRYRDSYLLQTERPYWQQLQGQMESMELTATGSRESHRLTVTLEGEPLKQLLTTSARAYNTEINDLLLTALSQSYHRLTDNRSLTIQMEGHGREPLHEPVVTDRTVGWFTSLYPVVIQDITGDVRHDVRLVKEVLRNVPNKGIGYGILQYVESHEGDAMLRTDLTPLVGFNYLGEVTDSNTEIVFTEPLGVSLPSIDVNCCIVSGRFVARFDYDAGHWTAKQAQQLADGFVEGLSRVVAHTSQVTAPEPTASDFGATGWTDDQLQTVLGHLAGRGEQLQRVYPLSPMQEGILITYLSDRDTTAYRLLFRLSLSALPTEAALRHTIDYLSEKHEVLRTAILFEDVPQPCQAIVGRQLGLEMRDLTGEQDIEAAATAVHQEMLHRRLSLTDDPLFQLVCMKTGDDSCQLLIFTHHIISDGWCTPIIFRDLLMKLDAETAGRPLPATTEQNGRYEAFVRQLLRRDRKAGLAYWKNLLADYDSRAALPSYGQPAGKDEKPIVSLTLDESLTASLRELAVRNGVTLNTVMELGWGLVLHSFCRTDDAVFLRVVSGRDGSDRDISQLVGPFINSVPVRVHAAHDATVSLTLKELQEQSAQSAAYDFCPLSGILSQTPLGTSLFQSVMAFENYPLGDTLSTLASHKWNIRPVQMEEEPFGELSIAISPEADGTLRLTFTYDTSLYNGRQIQQAAETFGTILRSMAAMPDGQLGKLPLVTPTIQTQLTELGKGEHFDLPPNETLVSLFRQQAAATPDAIAVVYEDCQMTYRKLDELTDRLAAHLINNYHIQSEEIVGVMIERSELMVVYPLSIMKAGAAYMPLDFHFPEERLRYMCQDAGVRLILSEEDRVGQAMPSFQGEVFTSYTLESLKEDNCKLPQPLPEHRYVILYTSGSTGKPKGVALLHHGIVNFCHWYNKEFRMTASDHALGYSNFGFDAHMMDLYPALTCGATVYIIGSEMRMDINALNDYMEQNGISIAFLTTQVGHLFASSIDNHSLRLLSVSGEKLMPVRKPAYEFYNCCGHTECTIYTTWYKIEEDYDSSVIGRPLDNYQLYVADAEMRLLPRGIAGELIICGEGVGQGYLHPSEKDKGKFTNFMGQWCYRTGDLVRWNSDDNLEYLGRIDTQVKLRGLRIELGEIESQAMRLEGIRQAVAIVHEGQQLCLYYTADGETDENVLREFLAEVLTDYMVPTAYMQIDALPLTPNGKVDRRRLPAIEQSLLHTDYVAPRNELEKLIVSGFEKVLNQEKISVNDDFVLLGGDSLAALKVVFSLGKSGITVADILSLRTPSAIASNVKGSAVCQNRYTIEGGCPLNNTQLFIYQDIIKFKKYDSYLIPSLIPIDRKYTDEQIRDALDAMFAAHPVLTMHVAIRDGVPYMEKGDKPAVMKGSLNPLKILSLMTSGFDLYSSLSRHIIVRIPGRCYLLSVIHHLIFDKISLNVFYRHFLRALEGASLDFVDDHFLTISSFHQEVRSTEQYAEMDKYIRTMLGNLSEACFYRNPDKPGKPGFHKRELGVDREQVNRFTERFGITKNILFAATMAMTLSKLVGNDDVFFGFLDNGRDRFGNYEDIGLYINGMPLLAHVDHHDMRAYLNNMADVYYKLTQNNFFPFGPLAQEFNIAPIILFQFFPDWIMEDGKYDHLPQNETLVNAVISTQKDLIVEALVDIVEIKNRYTINVMYSGYYSRKMMKALTATFKETLAQMICNE